MNNLSKDNVYRRLGNNDPSQSVISDVHPFADTYRRILTTKEYQYLTKKQYKMANFYSLPKLHKSVEINELLKGGHEYIHAENFGGTIEGRPIVEGPIYCTSGNRK